MRNALRSPSLLIALVALVLALAPHTLNSFLLDSHPNARGWEVSVADGGDTPEEIIAWAVCAKVEGGAPKAAAAHVTIHRFELPAEIR